jgi:hypothetical protein
MPRARSLKPGFFRNEDLIELNPLARLLFAGLWTLADRAGRLEDRPKRIKIEILPADNCDVDEFLGQLAEKGLIERYRVGAENFIAIPKWGKHQNPHINEVPSTIPAPDENSSRTVHEPDENSSSPADSLILTPCTLSFSCPESREDADENQKPKETRPPKVDDPIITEWFTKEFWPVYPRKDDRKNALRAALKHGRPKRSGRK